MRHARSSMRSVLRVRKRGRVAGAPWLSDDGHGGAQQRGAPSIRAAAAGVIAVAAVPGVRALVVARAAVVEIASLHRDGVHTPLVRFHDGDKPLGTAALAHVLPLVVAVHVFRRHGLCGIPVELDDRALARLSDVPVEGGANRPPRHHVVVTVWRGYAEHLTEVVHARLPGVAHGGGARTPSGVARVHGDRRQVTLRAVRLALLLVVNLPDQRLEHVLQRCDAYHPAALVNQARHVQPPLLELAEQSHVRHGLAHEHSLMHQVPHARVERDARQRRPRGPPAAVLSRVRRTRPSHRARDAVAPNLRVRL
mmetsp:Transcript_10552/g.43608  ORF Transcript_10552/g.43608 Transcript_10552/m.43608 type:complete len:309 (+) Transcript_10552:793-1719(+)